MPHPSTRLPDDPTERHDFLEWLTLGYGPLHAGEAVGWTHLQIMAALDDEEFGEAIKIAEQRLIEDLEEVVVGQAKRGRRWALEMFLYNRAPERWKPPAQRVKVETNRAIDQRVVVGVVATVGELLAKHGPAALQPGGILDAIESTATDGPEPD